MDPLASRVLATLRARRLLASGDRVLVAVSGGADSLVLAHLLAGLAPTLRLRVTIAHVDHRLRPDSADDARFVERFAQQLGVPARIAVRDVPALAASAPSASLEDLARQARYDALDDLARQTTSIRVAVAHTADDQAETVLMRLLRGAGPTGLAGIPMTRPLGNAAVIRPLLTTWRAEITEYLRRHALSAREDATNRDQRFVRNRVRHTLLPLLEQDYNPQVRQLLAQVAEQCQVDTAYLQTAVARYWKRLVKTRRDGGWTVRIAGVLALPEALQRGVMRRVVHEARGEALGMEFRHWIEIEQLLRERPAGSIVDLPGGVRLERSADHVIVRTVAARPSAECALVPT